MAAASPRLWRLRAAACPASKAFFLDRAAFVRDGALSAAEQRPRAFACRTLHMQIRIWHEFLLYLRFIILHLHFNQSKNLDDYEKDDHLLLFS